jgi:hypothetical protein
MKIHSAHRGLLAAAGLLTLLAAGCAVSDQLDLSDADVSGTGGAASNSGSGGTDQGSGGVATGGSATGGSGDTGAGGIIGTGGTGTGGRGTGGNGTGGTATGGTGTGGFGTAGTTGTGGIKGTGGSTSTGGTTGTGGIKGTGGSSATGGTTGTGGVKGTGGSTGTGGTGGSAAPTFTQVYTTILVVYCGGSSCHNPGTQGGVGFSTQSNAYNAVKSRVTPGNGAGSSFYTTVNSGSMPRGAAKLSAANLAMIKAWIDAGALNN